ncbi:MAG: aminoacyl-histidine dipeptidase [Lachnospiraceae bacterium]|nr:aminoacyl-histidine dipeptidase [Lachnospiraceae bacterium]
MSVLEGLEPREVFHYFEEISKIPRPSYKEEKISNYLVEFAKAHSLEYYQDGLNNVIIIKEATSGYEEVEPVIIQGHMDMVCEKEPDCTIDFEKDPLSLQIEGDYITANGTTLGGDDGIAVAYALAILDSDTIAHPRLEFICTVSEEVGMEGAKGIDVSMLKGKKLLNLDSEDEGMMLVSCAGGCSAECVLPAEWEKAAGQEVIIHVSGLKGGHSGAEIDKGRANSNLLLGRILLELSEVFSYQIRELCGGNKDNAIPRESKAVILVQNQAKKLANHIEEIAEKIGKEFSTSDPDIRVTVTVVESSEAEVLTADATRKSVVLLNLLPNGIQRMSDDIQGLVETSLNLGVMNLQHENLSLRYAVRSSVGTEKKYLLKKLTALTEEFGGSVTCTGDYPAWEYRKESKFREDMVRIFREMYGYEPKVEAIHAGLECGILAGKIQNLDGVSIGPDMIAIHTTEEKLSISSTQRVWEYILKVLACK